MKHVIGIALLATLLGGCVNLGPITGGSLSTAEPQTAVFVQDAAVRHEMAINFAGRGADYAMTFAVLRHGGEEMNPLLKPVFGNAEAKNVAYAAAVDALFTHVLGKIAEHAKKNGDPNWRRILRWNAYIHFGLSAWNAGQYLTNRQTVSAP
jgi:hypothetical protein